MENIQSPLLASPCCCYFILVYYYYLAHICSFVHPISGLEPKCPPALLLSCSPAPKNSQNLCNPLWRALASKPLNQFSSVTPFYKWEAMSFHHILSDLVYDFGKGPKRVFLKYKFWTYFLPRESHTILEMGSHDLSPHTFGSGLRFLKGSKRGFKKNNFWTYFLPRESLIGCNKNLCSLSKHLYVFILGTENVMGGRCR